MLQRTESGTISEVLEKQQVVWQSNPPGPPEFGIKKDYEEFLTVHDFNIGESALDFTITRYKDVFG